LKVAIDTAQDIEWPCHFLAVVFMPSPLVPVQKLLGYHPGGDDVVAEVIVKLDHPGIDCTPGLDDVFLGESGRGWIGGVPHVNDGIAFDIQNA
jgi:hypothetical protein